jgi:hypothetical protein
MSMVPSAHLFPLLFLVASAYGQRIWQATGDECKSQFLLMCPAIGDVDGDGHDDMVQDVERLEFVPPGFVNRSWEIGLLSGRTGARLRTSPLPEPPGVFWTTHGLASVGDVDGDRVGDYAVSMHDLGQREPQRIEVRSGRNNDLLRTIVGPRYGTVWGNAVLGDLDLDGDARPDFVISNYSWSNSGPTVGQVVAYANDTRHLYTITGDEALRYLHGSPRCVGKIGDVDGDGADDFGVGVLDRAQGRAGVSVFSGRTGQRLYIAMNLAHRYHAIGHVVLGCGDWDADGVPDFVTSTNYGVAVAFSGVDGRVLRTWTVEDGVDGAAMAVGDLDRDGMQDVVIKGNEFAGDVHALSGRDGQRLFTLTTDHPQSAPYFGVWLDVLRASDDGFLRVQTTDWGYGRYWWPELRSTWEKGRALVYRSVPDGVAIAGRACAYGLAHEPRIGFRRLATGARVHLSNVPLSAQAFLLVGVSREWLGMHRLPLDLSAFGFSGCTLYTSADLTFAVTAGASGIAQGYASVDIPLPLAVGGGGLPVYAQWKVFDGVRGFGASEMLTWPIRW